MKLVLGKELRKGDTIRVWWSLRCDTIVKLEPYRGTHEDDPRWEGARIAYFAQLTNRMTIFSDEEFYILNIFED